MNFLWFPYGKPENHGLNFFSSEVVWNLILQVLPCFTTTTTVGITFLIDLAIRQPPGTLANTSHPWFACFRNSHPQKRWYCPNSCFNCVLSVFEQRSAKFRKIETILGISKNLSTYHKLLDRSLDRASEPMEPTGWLAVAGASEATEPTMRTDLAARVRSLARASRQSQRFERTWQPVSNPNRTFCPAIGKRQEPYLRTDTTIVLRMLTILGCARHRWMCDIRETTKCWCSTFLWFFCRTSLHHRNSVRFMSSSKWVR